MQEATHTTATHTVRWHGSIDDIPRSDWDRIIGNGLTVKSWVFTKAVQRSALDAVEIRYLTVHRDGRLSGLAACFVFKVDIVILAPGVVRRAVAAMRKVFPSLLFLKLFFVGSPIATCENHMAIDPALAPEAARDVADHMFSALCEEARRAGCYFTIVKEIPDTSSESFAATFRHRFRLFPSLPTSRIPLLPGSLPFPSTLRRNYRKRFKSALTESNRAGHRWEVLEHYGHLSAEFHAMYLAVYDRSISKFEKLTPEFLARVNEELAGNSALLTCRDTEGRLIAAAVMVFDEERLVPLYLGLDYSQTQNTAVYYNVIFRAVLEAERRGMRCVVLGQSAYDAKAKSGAIFEPLQLGLHSNHRWGRWLIRWVFGSLFRETPLPLTVHNEAALADPCFTAACQG
ncbi:GNAT family N-acetyltransferase [Corallococcus exercitus]|uniref:GNAT family N-acetyltransferase n=1 Tax=Corallococcus exercitus TaxID=2316736 RepID=A0A3A8I7U7_9BACT|nr:GNAT family N-acetyltransferase [Corallococcus exercitus]NOK35999.1 GNAT family N-acetyltransferase [Corallococcus exercitus]RKG79519.1 GNAT family N-acetyltransferase [Corallococcus exercitus]